MIFTVRGSTTLANGSRVTYLPTAEMYETGAYPETIALLARGSLEQLADAIGKRLAAWQRAEGSVH